MCGERGGGGGDRHQHQRKWSHCSSQDKVPFQEESQMCSAVSLQNKLNACERELAWGAGGSAAASEEGGSRLLGEAQLRGSLHEVGFF